MPMSDPLRAALAEVERLRAALEELVTYQNGSPLPSYDEGWANAMALAAAAMRGRTTAKGEADAD